MKGENSVLWLSESCFYRKLSWSSTGDPGIPEDSGPPTDPLTGVDGTAEDPSTTGADGGTMDDDTVGVGIEVQDTDPEADDVSLEVSRKCESVLDAIKKEGFEEFAKMVEDFVIAAEVRLSASHEHSVKKKSE